MTYDPPSTNKNVLPFVTASAVTLAGAATTIITYVIHTTTGHALPEEVEQSILVIVEALFAFGAHRLMS